MRPTPHDPSVPIHFLEVDWERLGIVQAKYDIDTEASLFSRSRPEIERLCKAILAFSHDVDALARRQLAKYVVNVEPARSVVREFLHILSQWAYDARRQYARNHPPPYPWGHWRSDLYLVPIDSLVLFHWPAESEGTHRAIPGFHRHGGRWQPLGGKARREAPPLAWLDLPRLPSVGLIT